MSDARHQPAPPDQPESRLGVLPIAAAAVLWGTGGLAVEVVRGAVAMSPLVISAWRMVLAAVVLAAAVLVLRRTGDVVAIVRARPRTVVVVGASTAAYQALYFASVVLVGVSVATMVSLGLAPALLTVVEAVRRGRPPTTTRVVVVVLGLAGLVLVSLAGDAAGSGRHPVAGVLCALGSGTAYAATTVLGRPLTRLTSPVALTTTTTTVGAVVLLPLAGLAAAQGSPVLTTDPLAVGTLVYLGVFTMALAYALLYTGLRTTSGSTAVLATLLEPVTAAVAAAAFLGERLGTVGVAGTLLVLAAVTALGLGSG